MTSPQGTIFDLYKEEAEVEGQEVSSRPKSAQALREVGLGALQGAGDIAELMSLIHSGLQAPLTFGLLDEEGRKASVMPGQEAINKKLLDPKTSGAEFIALAGSDDDLVRQPILPGQRKALTETLGEIPEEGVLQEGTRRVTRSLPGLLGGPAVAGEMAARDLIGLGGKKTAEALGFGETGQTIFDLLFSVVPNPAKLIQPGKKIVQMAARGEVTTQKKMVEAARRMGMTENEIAPLVREGWFSNVLKKLSPRRGATERALDKTGKAVGRNFENIKKAPEATQSLHSSGRTTLRNGLSDAMKDLPAGAREAIAEDLSDLQKSGMTGSDVMNFWGDINAYFRQWPQLGSLKNPLRGALKTLSPKLAKDFEIANTLSQRFRGVASKLKPNIATDLFGAGEAMSIVGSFIHGGVAGLTGTIPAQIAIMGGRKLSQLMLTNPRFQNLTRKMVTTLNAGQAKSSMEIVKKLTNMVRKVYPEMAEELETMTIEDMEELLKEKDQSR